MMVWAVHGWAQPANDEPAAPRIGLGLPTVAAVAPVAGKPERPGCAGMHSALLGARCLCSSQGRRSTTFCDHDEDGVADYRIERKLDGDGHVSSEKTWTEGQVEPTRCARYRYDDAGRMRRASTDEDCDGTSDHSISYRYTDDGHPLSEWGDSDGDGTSDYTVRWRYDAAGARIRIEYRYSDAADLPDTTCRFDPPCSAPFDTCWQSQVCWEGDRPEPWPRRMLDVSLVTERGLVLCDMPSRCDGRNELCGCDSAYRVVFTAADLDQDGWVDEFRARVHHDDGSYTEQVDVGADGIVEVENTFDAQGRLLEAAWHDDYDGAVDRAMRYSFGDDGQLREATTIVAGQVMAVERYEVE